MNNELYPMIFKRKSFHLFRNTGNDSITKEELDALEAAFLGFESLDPSMKVELRIAAANRVNFQRGAEYCLQIYCEEKANYLMNAGYIGEQLDLYCVEHDIGTLWYGLGKTDEPHWHGLTYVITIAVKKVKDPSLYRRDMFKAKRKDLSEIWKGETLGLGEIARFAPSACNCQPWRVENDGKRLSVTRYKKQGKIGLLSPSAAFRMNRIDMGIFLCILEICMAEKGMEIRRTLFIDESDVEYAPVASYEL